MSIQCTYTNEDVIVAQWIIIWFLCSVFIVSWAFVSEAHSEPFPVASIVKNSDKNNHMETSDYGHVVFVEE